MKLSILAFIINILILDLYAATQGIDSNATNKEISKLISQVAPKTKNFKWSCETASSNKIPFTDGEGRNIVDKCIVDTDVGITLKTTCKYFIISKKVSETECISGW